MNMCFLAVLNCINDFKIAENIRQCCIERVTKNDVFGWEMIELQQYLPDFFIRKHINERSWRALPFEYNLAVENMFIFLH